jgi:hypothetical protein
VVVLLAKAWTDFTVNSRCVSVDQIGAVCFPAYQALRKHPLEFTDPGHAQVG